MKINGRAIVVLLLISAVFLLTPSANAQEAIRSLPDCVGSGTEFTVRIDAENYGYACMISEKLCNGWTYVGSSLPDYQVEVNGNTVKFILLGETSFTYTVRAPYGGSCCKINGILKDLDFNEYIIQGNNEVCTCNQVPAMSSMGLILLAGFMVVAGIYIIRKNS